MAEPAVYKKHVVCQHILKQEFTRHSTLKWLTEPVRTNSTDYHWDITIEFCPLCSGFAFAKWKNLSQPDINFFEQDG